MKDKIVALLLSHGWEIHEDEEDWRLVMVKGRGKAFCYNDSCTFYFQEGGPTRVEWTSRANSWSLLEWLAAEARGTHMDFAHEF